MPLSRSGSGHADDLGGAERVEATDKGDPDVDFCGLALGVPRGYRLPESLQASHPLAGRALRSNVPRGLASMRLLAWYPVHRFQIARP